LLLPVVQGVRATPPPCPGFSFLTPPPCFHQPLSFSKKVSPSLGAFYKKEPPLLCLNAAELTQKKSLLRRGFPPPRGGLKRKNLPPFFEGPSIPNSLKNGPPLPPVSPPPNWPPVGPKNLPQILKGRIPPHLIRF